MDTPRYLRREGTDLIFVATDVLLKRKDMEPYHGPVPLRKEAQKAVREPAVDKGVENTATEREDIVLGVVKSVPRKFFVAPAFGRPSMPRLRDVRARCGFDVTVDEVVAAVKKLEEL